MQAGEPQGGHGYDVCICVHAEANAIVSAARFGIAVEGSTLYSTLQPCFTCAKEALQAGVCPLVYGDAAEPSDPALHQQYRKLMAHFSEPPAQLSLPRSLSA